MRGLRPIITLGLVGLFVVGAFGLRADKKASAEAKAQVQAEAEHVGRPSFVELGADRCRSCKAMFPVLAELRETNGCDLNVHFVDVWKHPAEAKRFGIRSIPTQVLFAPDGSEIARHHGFWPAEAIKKAFKEKGYTLADNGACTP